MYQGPSAVVPFSERPRCCLPSSCYVSGSAASPTASTASAPIVDLGHVQYGGAYDTGMNVTSFKSTRYAAPPVGNLRFSAPQPPQNETATVEPDMCYQAGYGNSEIAPVSIHGLDKRATTAQASSEDCLYLNVYVPGRIRAEPTTNGGLPVVFWIHGGGYDSGTDPIQEAHHGVVVVLLCQPGFLAGNEVKAGFRNLLTTVDQRYAMEWAQKNIAAFGGDPSRVTIWGESAAADGGNTQPPLFYEYNGRVPQACTLFPFVVSQAGCSSTADTVACLRTVKTTTLATVDSCLAGTAFYGSYIWAPVVDGTFIVEHPTVTLAKGKIGGLSVNAFLAFGNTDEGADVTDPNETLTTTDYAAHMYRDMGSSLYQVVAVMSDSIFVCPTYYLLEAFPGRPFKAGTPIFPSLPSIHMCFCDPPPYNNTQVLNALTQTFMAFAMSSNVNAKCDPTNVTPY
ncbi:alpha/beta-hydrolase [Gyrodon lividus]|nr:alpha/beta-hydrolase [Gyrodon lividus]